jgi:hypothetical protein
MPAFIAGIHVLKPLNNKDVDGRDKPGHDERMSLALQSLRYSWCGASTGGVPWV